MRMKKREGNAEFEAFQANLPAEPVTKKRLVFLGVLLLVIFLICYVVWINLANKQPYESLQSQEGIWDLSQKDFSKQNYRLLGDVNYIPYRLLTPSEYDDYLAEETALFYAIPETYATSRIRIKVNGNDWYTLARLSIDYGERIYINGELLTDVGKVATSSENATPNTGHLVFTVQGRDGWIEIVQQSNNFVHRQGGYFGGWYVGKKELFREELGTDFATNLELGCYFTLFFLFLLLFCIIPNYKLSLYFALFCLAWFFRLGVTGPKVFTVLLPWMSWWLKFRIEYLCIPVAIALSVAINQEMFGKIFHSWFVKASYVLSAFFACAFLVMETFYMSKLMLFCQFFGGLVLLFLLIFIGRKVRQTHSSQRLFLGAFGVLGYAAIHDFLFYNGKYWLPPFVAIELSQVAFLAFTLIVAVSVSIEAIRQVQLMQQQKHDLALENAALDRVNHLRREMMATISHETRTPLAVLSSYSGLVAMELRNKGVDQQMAADLDKIAYEAKRVARLMDQMQNFSQTERLQKNRRQMDLAALIFQTARLYEPILERKKVALRLELKELPKVEVDGEEITQVLFNLLQNARNHTETGAVVVSAEVVKQEILVKIQDTGAGIRPELLPHVFERGMSSTAGGTGLGLSICQAIIQQHGGDLTIESQWHKGTTVAFTLPIFSEMNGKETDSRGKDV